MGKATSLKNRILVILLAIVTVIAYMPMNAERAYADATHPYGETPLTSDMTELYGGNYYVNYSEIVSISSITVKSNSTICLHGGMLQVGSITVKNGATLTIQDCMAYTTIPGKVDSNGVWHYEPSYDNAINTGVLTSNGGTGTLITVESGSFVMNGGTIAGHNGTIISTDDYGDNISLSDVAIRFNNVGTSPMFWEPLSDSRVIRISGNMVIDNNLASGNVAHGADAILRINNLGQSANVHFTKGNSAVNNTVAIADNSTVIDMSKLHLDYTPKSGETMPVLCIGKHTGNDYLKCVDIVSAHNNKLSVNDENEIVFGCEKCNFAEAKIYLSKQDDADSPVRVDGWTRTGGFVESLGLIVGDLQYLKYNSSSKKYEPTDDVRTGGRYKAKLTVEYTGDNTQKTIEKEFQVVCGKHSWLYEVKDNGLTFECEACGEKVGPIKVESVTSCEGQGEDPSLTSNPIVEPYEWIYQDLDHGVYSEGGDPKRLFAGTYTAVCKKLKYKDSDEQIELIDGIQAPYIVTPHEYQATASGNKATFYCEVGGTRHADRDVVLSVDDTFAGKVIKPRLSVTDSDMYHEPAGGYFSYQDKNGSPLTSAPGTAGAYKVKATLAYGDNKSVDLIEDFNMHEWVADCANGTATLKCADTDCSALSGSIAINTTDPKHVTVDADVKYKDNPVDAIYTIKYFDTYDEELSSAPTKEGTYTAEVTITSPVNATISKQFEIGGCHGGYTAVNNVTGFPTTAGNYYLTENLKLTKDVNISGNIVLCLNGYNIDVAGHTINDLGGNLTIRDCNDDKNTVVSKSTNGSIELTGGVITGGAAGKNIFNLNEAVLNLSVNIAGNSGSVANTVAGSTVNLNGAYITGNAMPLVFNGAGAVNLVDTKISGNTLQEISAVDGQVSVSGNTIVRDIGGSFKHIFKISGVLGSDAYLDIYRNQKDLEVKVAEGDGYTITEADAAKCHITAGTGYNEVVLKENAISIKHNHNWEINTPNTTKYTQHCKNSGADYECCEDKIYEVELVLDRLSDTKTVVKIDETNTEAKFETEVGELKYYDSDNNEIEGVPSIAGTYTAKAVITSVDGTSYTLTQTVELQHSDATATVTGKTGLEYTGNAQELVTVADATGTVKYSLDGTSFSTSIPEGTDAGTYKVWYQVVHSDSTHYDSKVFGPIEVTIAKADATATVTAIDNLTYNGNMQNLVTGTVTGGTLQYSLDGTNWSEDVPQGKDAGNYTVSYKVAGDENHNDFTPNTTVAVTIAKRDASVTPTAGQSKTEGDADPVFKYTANLVSGDALEGALGREAGEAVGTYAYTIGTLANANYNLTLVEGNTFEIKKKSGDNPDPGPGPGPGPSPGPGPMPPIESTEVEAITGLVYTGEAQNLVKGGDKDTLYSLDGTTFTAAIPTGTDAGEYTVTYKQSSKTETLKVTIKKADVKLAEAPLASSITSEKKLSASVISGGSVLFGDKPVEGTFAWETPDVVPGVSGEYTCIFTPSTGNFNTVTCKVKVTVKEGKAYPITLEKTGKGTVTISDYEPVKGDEVTVKLAPSTGYLIKSVKFTYSSGRAVPDQYVEKVSSKKYILTQPGRRVTITVVFAKDPTYVSEKTMNKNSITLNNDFTVLEADYGYDVTWGKVKGADGYIVSTNYCGSKLTTKCRTYVKSGSKTSVYIDKIKGVNYNMKKNVRVYVRAYKLVGTKKITIGKTFTAHMAAPLSETYTNVKELRTNESELNLKKGKTAAITVSRTILYDQDKKELTKSHSAQRHYYTTNASVATVSSEGIVTAKGAGTCDVYVRAQNGVKKKVTINVE